MTRKEIEIKVSTYLDTQSTEFIMGLYDEREYKIIRKYLKSLMKYSKLKALGYEVLNEIFSKLI